MDYGHQQTDKILADIERRLKREYATALKDMKERVRKALKKFEADDKKMVELLKQNKIKYSEYIEWRTRRMIQNDALKNMSSMLAENLTHTNEIAAGIINERMADVYALNMNYGTYEIESGTGINTSFDLYDRLTVENLMKDDPKVLPLVNPDIPKDERWNRQKITSALTQGILNGDSIPHIADRLEQVTNMTRSAAIRNARTYTTSAESKGRMDSYERAHAMGIHVMKEWMSTIDIRTRDSHVDVDGERRELDEEFSNGLDRPGGMGPPEEVYNCRCRLVAYIPDFTIEADRVNNLDGMSYEEWQEGARRRLKEKQERKKMRYGRKGN